MIPRCLRPYVDEISPDSPELRSLQRALTIDLRGMWPESTGARILNSVSWSLTGLRKAAFCVAGAIELKKEVRAWHPRRSA